MEMQSASSLLPVRTNRKTGVMYIQQVLQKIPGRNPSISLICSENLFEPVVPKAKRRKKREKLPVNFLNQECIEKGLVEFEQENQGHKKEGAVGKKVFFFLVDTCYFRRDFCAIISA